MINKNKILNAINEGILTGFKLSSTSNIDDSSYVDFSDAKIDKVESLNMNMFLKDYVLDEDWYKVRDLINECPSCKYKVANQEELLHIISEYTFLIGKNSDLNWLDVSNVTTMSNLFLLSSFNGDISKWDVSNVKDMQGMFHCSKFNGDISNWNVSNVKDMRWMFADSRFNNDLSKWDISLAKNSFYANQDGTFNKIYHMFDGCPIKNEFKPKIN